MKNLIEYIKDKIYYILAATILIIVILVLISSCSGSVGSRSYEEIENDMVNAARKYYSSREAKLPNEEGNSVKVTIGTLIDAELLDEAIDPNNKNQKCSGYVEVKKVNEDYVYIPFLTCEGNYEPEYLVDVVKNSKLDEYGNGVYEMNGEYVYRGDDVNNYVLFNNQVWRILRVNNNNEIKLILNERTEEEYTWETSYNINEGENVGITTDYLNTNMRKTLLSYYENNFSEESKAFILNKTWCIGGLSISDDFNKEKECSKTKENEYVGLMNVSDYGSATLDVNCTNPNQAQCTNRNYLTETAKVNTWTMNTIEGSTYQVYRFSNGNFSRKEAADDNYINPVIFLSSNVVVNGGGSLENPYIVK